MRSCASGQQQGVASHLFVLPTGVALIISMPLPHKLLRVSPAGLQAAPEPLSPPPRPSLA